ncbi:MAG: MBL fold metallo-hydrolase [Candidatus Helarchaeota archaeon]
MKLIRITKRISMFIPSGTPMLNANVYFINDDINTIIDTGTSFTLNKSKLIRILKNLEINKIDRIIITHTHHDHCANVGSFQDLFDCEVLAHPSAIPILTKKPNSFDFEGFEFLEFLENAVPFLNSKSVNHPIIKNVVKFIYSLYQGQITAASDVTPVHDNEIVSCGTLKLKIFHTPGHSRDSICILDLKNRILFSGDSIPFTPYIQTSIQDIIYSIKKIMSTHPRFVFRSHAYRPHPWCEEFPIYIEFLDSISRAENRIIKALKLKGPLPLHKIVPLMYERSHIGHYRFYKLMRTDNTWAFKYLQDLENKHIVKRGSNNKYYLLS